MHAMPPEGLSLHDERAGWLEGVRLFNDGHFFEAHDAWEEIWHRVTDRRREKFYRAVIQAAVTLELLRRGRAVGVRQVYVSCLKLFEGLPETFMGLHIPGFVAKLRHAIEPVIEDLETRTTRIDPTRLFAIELEYDAFADSRNGEAARIERDPAAGCPETDGAAPPK